MLIISDGGDNHSRYTEGEIKSMVKEADMMIYAIGIYDHDFPTEEERLGPQLLSDVTELTGGRAFTIDNPNDLADVSTKIGIELRNQYVLGYRPKNPGHDGKWRKIKVKLLTAKGIAAAPCLCQDWVLCILAIAFLSDSSSELSSVVLAGLCFSGLALEPDLVRAGCTKRSGCCHAQQPPAPGPACSPTPQARLHRANAFASPPAQAGPAGQRNAPPAQSGSGQQAPGPAAPAAGLLQTTPPPERESPSATDNGVFVFRKEVAEVTLHATVVDERNRIITNLDRYAFTHL